MRKRVEDSLSHPPATSMPHAAPCAMRPSVDGAVRNPQRPDADSASDRTAAARQEPGNPSANEADASARALNCEVVVGALVGRTDNDVAARKDTRMTIKLSPVSQDSPGSTSAQLISRRVILRRMGTALAAVPVLPLL